MVNGAESKRTITHHESQSMDNYKQLLIDHIPNLRRYARALTGDAEKGDILVKRCLECAHNLLSFLQPDTNFVVWLFSIMHNISSDYFKEEQASTGIDPSVLDFDFTDLPIFQEDDESLDLESALYQLAVQQKEAYLLVSLERLTYAQVCSVLNISQANLISRLDSARKFLVEQLFTDTFADLRAVQ